MNLQSPSIKNVTAALAKAQAEFPNIRKNKAVKKNDGKVMYTFADLESILETITPVLHQNGLVLFHSPVKDSVAPTTLLYTQLTHIATGEFIASCSPVETISDSLLVELVKTRLYTRGEYDNLASDVAKLLGVIRTENGKANTYLRRYAIVNLLGIVAGEDDSEDNPNETTEPPKQKSEFISDKQVGLIKHLTKNDQSIIRNICTKYKVNSLEELNWRAAKEVIDVLNGVVGNGNKN